MLDLPVDQSDELVEELTDLLVEVFKVFHFPDLVQSVSDIIEDCNLL